jgi:hypothetical protein
VLFLSFVILIPRMREKDLCRFLCLLRFSLCAVLNVLPSKHTLRFAQR